MREILKGGTMIRRMFLCLFIAPLLVLLWCRIPAWPAYEPPADQVLIFIDTEGGVRGPIYDLAKVPLFCLYKNGDLLYSFLDKKQGRVEIMQAALPEKECESLLRLFYDRGLEEWNEYYEDCPIKDMPVTRIMITTGKEQKKIHVMGIDYAMNNKTIPEGLAQAFRKLRFYSPEGAKEYESPQIILYVKKLDKEPKGEGVRVQKWGIKIELAPIADEAGLTGFGSLLLEGKNAKSVVKELESRVPFSRPELFTYFKQGNNFYTLGYRPLLLHEREASEKGEKKGGKEKGKKGGKGE
jgi:hypothetical protein